MLIMTYGEHRNRWSSCSNQDFARYYKTVLTKNDKFCLETALADTATDCVWNEWSSWSPCSATCREGWQRAGRSLANVVADGGDICEGEKERTQKCMISTCHTGKYIIFRIYLNKEAILLYISLLYCDLNF